jgi:ketosteroid isomerase-like protein
MSANTSDVLAHHLNAFAQGNVDETLKDYTDDSILMHPDGIVKGLAELGSFFSEIYKAFPPGNYSFEMRRQEVHGEVAYIVWKADTPSLDVPVGTDTFVIRDGKIVVQTFAGQLIPK